jgi:hypothetical protein
LLRRVSYPILIWEKPIGAIQKLRAGKFAASSGLAGTILRVVKPIAKKILRRGENGRGYMLVALDSSDQRKLFSENLPREDGHPSFCPSDRAFLLTDTYPDKEGIRKLLVYNGVSGSITDYGRYKQADIPVDIDSAMIAARYADSAVIEKFGIDAFAYSRSGIHCDLHPRWRRDGKKFCFDSNHEGSRQVYICDFHQ